MDKLNGKQIKWKIRKGKEPFHSTLESGAHVPDIATLTASFPQGVAVRSHTPSYPLVTLLEQKKRRERKQPGFRVFLSWVQVSSLCKE